MQTGSKVLQQRHLDWYVDRVRLGTGRDKHLYSPTNQDTGLGTVRGNEISLSVLLKSLESKKCQSHIHGSHFTE